MTGLLLAGGLVLSPPAYAQDDPGVHVDPGSPSKKEYALPVDDARGKAESKKQSASSDNQSAPLFGEGANATPTPTPTAAPTPDATKAKRRRAERRAKARIAAARARKRAAAKAAKPAASSTPSQTPAVVRAAAVQPATPEGGLGTTLLLVGGGVSVLVLAVSGGIVARQRGQRDQQ